jgi:hypothetical protein
VFFVVVAAMVVQVSVMQIIDMIFVFHGSVAASRSVDVDVVIIGVNL